MRTAIGGCAGSKGVLDEDFVAGGCEEDADRGFIAAVVLAELFVDDLDVGRELANVAAVGFADLQLEHDEAAETEVVEEQVDKEFTLAHTERDLPTDEGETVPEFRYQMG